MKPERFKDRSGREWEIVLDTAYYDTICVRCLSVDNARSFYAPMAFNFENYALAAQFKSLVMQANSTPNGRRND